MLISRLLLKDRSWFVLLALTLIVLLTSAVRWMLDHPYAFSWDEADYFNDVLADQSALRDSGLRGLRPEILYTDRGRPPAFRLLAIPFYLVLGFSPLKLRLVSLGFHWLGLVFLYLTTRKIASPKCAVLSVLICCLSPDVLFSSVVFYTEYPLFLATTAAFYFLVSSIESRSDVPQELDWPRPIDRSWVTGEDLVCTGRSSGLGFRTRCRPHSWPQRPATVVCHQGGCAGNAGRSAVVVDKRRASTEASCIRQELHLLFTWRAFVRHLDILAPFSRTEPAGTWGDHRDHSYPPRLDLEAIRYDETLALIQFNGRCFWFASVRSCRSCWSSLRARTTSFVICARLSYLWQSQSGCSPT